ncbi:MAG: T9SS type A sorting domain-containing protein [Bacteroidetes bacterium]|nr:T9SS type A sorting domain-containing protein [Bacteroidota bacterium]
MRLLFLSLFLLPLFSFSQNGFTSYGTPTGYKTQQLQNKNAIVIDSNGNKWVAFQRIGLAKYDGSVWTMYNVSNSGLPSDTVNALAVDGANNIWVGTLRGLAKFDGTNWTIYDTSNSSIPNNNILSVAVNGNNIWIGTRTGAAIYNGSAWTTYNKSNSGIVSDTVKCFAFDQSANIFLGTPKGLSRLNGTNWATFNMNNSGLQSNNITCLYYFQGDVWIGTSGGLHKYSSGTIIQAADLITGCTNVAIYTFGNIFSIAQGPSGGIAFSSYAFLIEIFPSTGTIQKYESTYFTTNKAYLAYDAAIGLLLFTNDFSSLYEDLYSFNVNLYTDKTPIVSSYPGNMNFLDINEVRTMILNRGDLHWDYTTQVGSYEVPKCSGRHSIYASAIWMGGLDMGGNLHLAGQEYGHSFGSNDYFPGPINAVNPSAFDTVWKVNRYKVEEFKYEWALGNVQNATYTPDSSILGWPAVLDSSCAPFVDVNGNGIYDPLTGGDYPKIKGDQCIYWIMNDQGVHDNTGGLPLGVEIHAMAYAFMCPQLADSEQVLNYTTLYHYEIFNKSVNQYDSVYFGLWQDADLGNYQDDYVGCYPQGNYGYVYNGDSIDDVAASGYGARPPILSNVILNGPLADVNDSIDNNNNGTIDEAGEKNLMTGFGYWIGGMAFPQSDPGTALEYYNYLNNKWQNGSPFTYGGTGLGGMTPTHFLYPDFPYDTSGWSENGAPPPSDRRSLLTSGPFTLLQGAKVDYDFAIVWSRDISLPWLSKASFDDNLFDVQKIQQWFAADSFPSCLQINLGVEEENQNTKNELTLYPNPATDILFISYKPQTKNTQFEIIDVMGRKVSSFKLQVSGSEQQLNISKLPQGLYLLKVTDEDLQFAKRFVKN